jgi:hypothetical protein
MAAYRKVLLVFHGECLKRVWKFGGKFVIGNVLTTIFQDVVCPDCVFNILEKISFH